MIEGINNCIVFLFVFFYSLAVYSHIFTILQVVYLISLMFRILKNKRVFPVVQVVLMIAHTYLVVFGSLVFNLQSFLYLFFLALSYFESGSLANVCQLIHKYEFKLAF